MLRPVDQTEVAFRDHPSTSPAIRLTHWDNLAINDYLLVGRELMRIQALPRNLDDDCVFWGQQGQRLGWLETTPEQHPMGQPMYKVEIHPPGTVFPPGGVPTTTLDLPERRRRPGVLQGFARDVRRARPTANTSSGVEDVRGLGGGDYGLSPGPAAATPLVPGLPRHREPEHPRGGTELVDLTLIRRDGFDSPVEVVAEGLPPGITATPARIEGHELSGILALSADTSAPAFSPPTWRVVAREVIDPGTAAHDGPPQHQEIDPGGPEGGRITVTPAANLTVSARPDRVVIRPGERVSMTLAVRGAPAFAGRVPIEVKNLPQGVRVLDIGLNGVLITETQAERSVFLLAEPWVQPMVRPFFAVAKAESAGTEDSSPPIELVISPPRSTRNSDTRK